MAAGKEYLETVKMSINEFYSCATDEERTGKKRYVLVK